MNREVARSGHRATVDEAAARKIEGGVLAGLDGRAVGQIHRIDQQRARTVGRSDQRARIVQIPCERECGALVGLEHAAGQVCEPSGGDRGGPALCVDRARVLPRTAVSQRQIASALDRARVVERGEAPVEPVAEHKALVNQCGAAAIQRDPPRGRGAGGCRLDRAGEAIGKREACAGKRDVVLRRDQAGVVERGCAAGKGQRQLAQRNQPRALLHLERP